MQRTALLQAWIVIIVIFGLVSPGEFLTTTNFSSIFGSQAFVVFLVLALVIVLRVGEFDLSVAATMTVAADLVAILNAEHGVPILAAILVTLVVGACIGLANGVLVVGFKVDSFIATLGMSTVLGGASLWITNQETIVGVSSGLVSAVIGDRVLGIPLGFYYAVALAGILGYLFSYTVLGRRMLFVGKNADVARLGGFRVERLKIGAFVLTGLISAIAGVLFTGTRGSADPSSGLAYLLPVYAAAFLGSTTTRGGEFTAFGSVVAVYFLATATQGLAIAGVEVYAQQMFYGGVLVVAIVAAKRLMREKKRQVVAVDTG